MIKPIHYTLFLTFAISHQANAQHNNHRRKGIDSLNRYFSLTLITGAQWQYRNHTAGAIGISLPYTTTDASGNTTSHTFTSQSKRVYSPNQFIYGLFGIEIGDLHHCIAIALSVAPHEGIYYGERISAGYGRVWFLNGPGQHYSIPQQKTFILKTLLNLVYTEDMGVNNVALLGRIDNSNQTLHLLGDEAGPTFNIPSSRSGPGGTYNAKNLDLSYAQQELSLVPQIALSTNPFRHMITFELDLGYSIPLLDGGGVYMVQDDGSVTSHNINYIDGPVSLKNTAITATLNGKPIRSIPYRLGGPYAAFKIEISGGTRKRKSR
jgi:hypothetical protein